MYVSPAAQPRFVGSSERYATSTRAWPSSSASVSASCHSKSDGLKSPSGRAARRHCAFFGHQAEYSGSLPGFHLMLQPTLARCSVSTGRSASTASSAARRSRPLTSTPLPGRLSSSWPR